MARGTQILSQVRVKVPDLALKQNKEVSSENTALKGEVTPALETKATPLVPSVSSELKPLQAPPQSSPISNAIEQHIARKVDQSLEQQLYSAVWGGVAAAIIKTATPSTPPESRRAIEELQQLLVASDAREKKRKGSNIWDSSFFRSIATIIGPEAAETVTKKIEHFSKQTNNSPAAVNQLVKDIAAALTTGDSIQRLHIATEIVENAIASEINARLVVEAPVEAPGTTPAQIELEKKRAESVADFHKRAAKGDLLSAVQFNPEVGLDILKGPQAAQILDAHLSKLKTSEERVGFLTALKIGIGAARMVEIVDGYSKATGRPLAYDIVVKEPTPEAQALAFRKVSENPQLLTTAQIKELKEFVRRDYTLMAVAIKRELEGIDGKLDQNAKKIVTASNYISKALNKPELLTLPQNEILEACNKAIKESYRNKDGGLDGVEEKTRVQYTNSKIGVSSDKPKNNSNTLGGSKTQEQIHKKTIVTTYKPLAEITLEETTAFLRKQAGETKVVDGKDVYNPIGEKQEQAAVLLGNLEAINKLEKDNIELKKTKENGVDGELTKLKSSYTQIFGEKILEMPADKLAQLENGANLYLSGFDTRIDAATSGPERAKIIQERDAIDWLVVNRRLKLCFGGESTNLEKARSLLSSFSHSNNPPPRGEVALKNASTAGKMFEELKKHESDIQLRNKELTEATDLLHLREGIKQQQILSQMNVKNCIQHHGPATKEINFKSLDAFFSNGKSDQKTTKPEGYKDQQRLLLDAITKPPNEIIPKDALPTLEDKISDIDEGLWQSKMNREGCMAKGQKALLEAELAATSTSPFISGSLLHGVDPKTTETVAELKKILTHNGGSALTGEQLMNLRVAAKDVPELENVFAQVPALPNDSAEESRQILARLPGEQSGRLRLLAANLAITPQPAAELWAKLNNLKREDLPVALDAALAQAKVVQVTKLLDKMTLEERTRVEANYKTLLGDTVGTTLLKQRPVGTHIVELSGTTLVTNGDLARYFPAQSVIPTDPKERRTALEGIYTADSTVATPVLKPLLKLQQEQAPDRAIWSTTLQLSKDDKDIQRARTELNKLDKDLTDASIKAFKGHSPDYLARHGRKEYLGAMQEYAHQMASDALLSPNSKVITTLNGVVDVLSQPTPNFVKAEELLRRGNFSENEMVLVRTLYAGFSTGRVNSNERKLTGNLAQDLISSKNPNDLETKRAQLLATGGKGRLTEADILLIQQGVAKGDERMLLRGLIALKAAQGAQYAGEAIEELLKDAKLSPETTALINNNAYVKAVRENDTVKQAELVGYELRNDLANGVMKASEAVNVIQRYKRETIEEIGKVSGLSDLMGEYKGALDKVVNSTTYEEGVKEFAATSLKLNDVRIFAGSLALVPKDKVDDFIKDLNKTLSPGRELVEYIKSQNGWKGQVDGVVVEKIIILAKEGKSIPEEQLKKIEQIRQGMELSMEAISGLHNNRVEFHSKSNDILTWIRENKDKAQKDRDNSPILSYFNSDYANRITNTANFEKEHLAHLNDQGAAVADLRQTTRVMTVMAVVMVKDVLTGEDRGLRTEHAELQGSRARERDLARTCWVIVRKDHLDAWQSRDAQYQKSIASTEFWADAGALVSKVVVVGVVSFFGSPAAGFLVATAWNAADKVYRVKVNGMDPWAAVTAYGIGGVMDIAFMGLAAFKSASIIVSPGTHGAKVLNPLAKRVFKLDLWNPGKNALKLNEAGTGIVVHAQELAAAGGFKLGEGGSKIIAKDVAKLAEKQFINGAKEGIQQLQVEIGWTFKMLHGAGHVPTSWVVDKESPKEIPKIEDLAKKEKTPDPPIGIISVKSTLEKPPPEIQDLKQKLQELKEKVLDNPALLAVVEALIAKWQALPQDLKEKISNNPTLLAAVATINDLINITAWAKDVILTAISGLIADIKSEIDRIVKEKEAEEKNKADKEAEDKQKEAAERKKAEDTQKEIVKREQGTIYGNYGGLFDNITFGDSLNTGSIWTKNTTQNVLPTLPPSPPKPPTPPVFTILPPKKPDSGGGTTGPIAVSDGEGRNSYVLKAEREEKIEAEKIVAEERLREVSAQARNISQQNTQAIATPNATAQQLAVAARDSQAAQQFGLQVALVDGTIIAQSMANTTILASPIQQSQSQSQEQSQEPLRLLEGEAATYTYALTAATSVLSAETVATTTTLSTIDTVPQQIIGTRLQPTVTLKELAQDEEILVRTNLVAKKDAQIKDAQLDNISKEETSTAASAEQDKLASVSKQASALNIRVEQAAEVETVQVLSLKEQQTVIAEQLLTEQIISESIHRAQEQQLLSQIEKVQAAAALVTAQSLVTASLKGSLATPLMAEATPFLEVTPFLEATPDYEPLFPSNESDPAPVRKVQRKVKSLKEQDRLRNIVMQQLLTLNFNQSRKSDLLKLLITLGISEKEYRELVAKVGEAEARSMAAKAEGREKVARRIEAPLESAKEPVRLKGEVKPATAKISRAELYVRMKQ